MDTLFLIPTNQTQLTPETYQEAAERVFSMLDVNEATRKDYGYRIGTFLAFIRERGLGRNSYLEYKRHLAERTDVGISTKNKYLITAKIFLKELNRQGALPVDITQNVKGFTQSKKHRRSGFNDEEVTLVVEKMRNMLPTPQNARLKALFCFLAFQGLRQVEIIRLDVKDIDLANGVAMVRGKGRDDKEPVLLSPETVKAVREYMKANRIADGALFPSLGNRKSERITTMTVKREIKGLLEPLGIEKCVHGFRHFYITTLLKQLSVRDVRKFSRHAGLEMLVVYDDEMDIKAKSVEVFRCFDAHKVAA
jgi:integrase